MTTTKELFNKLERSGYEVNKYTYPDNLGSEEFYHSILFNIYEYDNKKLSEKKNFNTRRISGDVPETFKQKSSKVFRSSNPSYNSKKTLVGTNKRLSDTIALYMPNNIGAEYSVEYTQENVQQGLVLAKGGKLAGQGASALADAYGTGLAKMGKNIFKNVTSSVKSALDSKSKSKSIETAITAVGTGKETPLKGSLSVYEKIARNPHMEYMFNQVNPRTFSFEFNFSPKNATEVRRVRNIIKSFKVHQMPKINKLTSSLGVYYEYPAQFDITFLSGGTENKWQHKISTSVLTNISVNYTAGGEYLTFNDLDNEGTPPALISMSLTFQEIEIMSRERMEQGY